EIDITDDTTICSVAQIQLSAVPSVPTLNYTFDWKPTKNMTNNKVFNPKVSPDQSTTYTVTIGSDSGCVKQESVTVTLSPPFPRNNILSATDTIICLQDTVTLGVELGDVSPAVCGISVGTSCVGNTSVKQVGSGTSQNSTTGINQWPTPFA